MAGVSGSEVLYKRKSKLGMTTLTFRSRRYTFPSVIVKGDMKGDMKREGDMCVMLDVGLFCPFCTGAYQAKFMSSQSKLAITKTPSQDSLSGQAVSGREHCALDNSQETTSASGYYDEKLAEVTLGPHQQSCVHQHGTKQSIESGESSCTSTTANAEYLPEKTALSTEYKNNQFSQSENISVAEKRQKSHRYFREEKTKETEISEISSQSQIVEEQLVDITGPDSPDTSDGEPVRINISIGENEASVLQTELENLSKAQEPVQIEFTESIPYMESGTSNVESQPVTSTYQMCDSMDSIGRSDYGSLDTSTTSKTLDDSLQSVQEMLETLSTDFDSIERMTLPLVDSGNCFNPTDTVHRVSEGPEITETKHESLERIPRIDVTARNSALLAQAPPHKRHSDDVTMRSEYTHSLLTASEITTTDVTDHVTIQAGPEMTPQVNISQKLAIPELKIDLSSREDLDFCVSDDEQLDVANAMEDDLVAELLGDDNIDSDDDMVKKEFFGNMAPTLPDKQMKDYDKDKCDKLINDDIDSNSSDNGEDSFTTARHIMGNSVLGSISNQPILQEDDRDTTAESKHTNVATETYVQVVSDNKFSVPEITKRETSNLTHDESDEDENRSLSPESFLDSVLEEMESEIISGEATLGRIFSLKRDFHSPETPVEQYERDTALSTKRTNSEPFTPGGLDASMESENVFPTPEPTRQYPRQPSPETLLEEVLESMAEMDDSYDWTSDYESDENDINDIRPSIQTKTDYQFTSTDLPQRDDNMTSSCECMAGDTMMETGSSIEPAPSTNTDTSDTSFDFSADEYLSDSDDGHNAIHATSEKSFEKIIGETKLLTENLLAIFCENLNTSEMVQQNNESLADNSQKSARTSKIVSVETSFLNGSSANVEVKADLEATVTTDDETVLTNVQKEQAAETEVLSVKPINEPDDDSTITNDDRGASNDLNSERISDNTARSYKETYNILNTSKQEKLSIEEAFHFDQICAPKSPVLHKSPAYAKVNKIPTLENENKPTNITESNIQKHDSQSSLQGHAPQHRTESQYQNYPSDDVMVPQIVHDDVIEVIDAGLNAEIPLIISKEEHGQILINKSELQEYADNKRKAETSGMAYLSVHDASLDISLSESDIEDEFRANYLDASESLEDLLDSDVSSEFDLLDDNKPSVDEKQKCKNFAPLQVNVHDTSSNQSFESRNLNGPLSPVTDDYLPEVVEPPAKPEIVKQVYEAAQIVSKLLEQHHVTQPSPKNENSQSETDGKGDHHSHNGFDAAIQNGDFSHLVSEASTNVAQFETKDVLSKGQAQDFIRYVLGGKHEDQPHASNDVHSCLQEVCQSCVDTKEVGESDDTKAEEVTCQEVTLVFAWPKHKQRPAYKGNQPFREIHLHRVTRITDFDVEVIEGPTIETIEHTPDGIKREKSALNKDTAKLKRLTPASKTESHSENKNISKSQHDSFKQKSSHEIDQKRDDLAKNREGCTSPPADSFNPEITPLLFHSDDPGNNNLVLAPEAKRVPDTAVNNARDLQTSIALSDESRHTDEQVVHENGEIRTENKLKLDLAISDGSPQD